MKKYLFVLIGLLICNSFLLGNEVYKEILSSSNWTGVSKEGNFHDKFYGGFFVGYNDPRLTYGRAYLDFDLTSIPTGATITDCYLLITTYIDAGNDINGNVQIRHIQKCDNSDNLCWNNIGYSPIIGTLTLQEGSRAYFDNSQFRSKLKEAFGGHLYIGITHLHESNRKIGLLMPDCYLVVKYKELDTVNIFGSSSIVVKNMATYTASYSGHTSSSNYNWTTSNSNISIVSGQGTKNVTIKGNSTGSATLFVSVGGVSASKSITITSTTTNITGQTITSNKNYTNDYIIVSNTTIQNNAIVNMTAANSVIISPTFHAKEGTTVTIKATGSSLRNGIEEEFEIIEERVATSVDELDIERNIVNIKAFNLTGKLIYSSNNNFELTNLNLSDGIYIVEKQYSDGNIIREKILLKK